MEGGEQEGTGGREGGRVGGREGGREWRKGREGGREWREGRERGREGISHAQLVNVSTDVERGRPTSCWKTHKMVEYPCHGPAHCGTPRAVHTAHPVE